EGGVYGEGRIGNGEWRMASSEWLYPVSPFAIRHSPSHAPPNSLSRKLFSLRCGRGAPAFGIGAGGSRTLLRTGIVGAGEAAACAARLMTIGWPRGGSAGGTDAISAGGASGASSGAAGFQTPEGRPAGGTPCSAAFMKRLQISTGR